VFDDEGAGEVEHLNRLPGFQDADPLTSEGTAASELDAIPAVDNLGRFRIAEERRDAPAVAARSEIRVMRRTRQPAEPMR
jgi:hypothetical protein